MRLLRSRAGTACCRSEQDARRCYHFRERGNVSPRAQWQADECYDGADEVQSRAVAAIGRKLRPGRQTAGRNVETLQSAWLGHPRLPVQCPGETLVRAGDVGIELAARGTAERHQPTATMQPRQTIWTVPVCGRQPNGSGLTASVPATRDERRCSAGCRGRWHGCDDWPGTWYR